MKIKTAEETVNEVEPFGYGTLVMSRDVVNKMLNAFARQAVEAALEDAVSHAYENIEGFNVNDKNELLSRKEEIFKQLGI